MSQGRSTPCIGDGRPPTFNDGNPYFMGPYKPLRNWVDEFIPYYMEMKSCELSLDPIANIPQANEGLWPNVTKIFRYLKWRY